MQKQSATPWRVGHYTRRSRHCVRTQVGVWAVHHQVQEWVFLTFQVKHFPVGCQDHSQIIISDTAPGFVFWLHHGLLLCFSWFRALGDGFSCPQLLIKLSSIREITYVGCVSGRMFCFNRCLPTSTSLSPSWSISAQRLVCGCEQK